MARQRDDDREITVIEAESGAGSIGWFLLGTALGAGLGLLFAPQSGRRTRRQIRRRADQLRSEAGDRWEELVEEVGERGERIRERAGEIADDVKDGVDRGRKRIRRKAASARDDLERRLEDARARRRATVAADGVADIDDDEDDGDDA